MDNKQYKTISTRGSAKKEDALLWHCYCCIRKIPSVVVYNEQPWSTVEFDLEPVWCSLTQEGLDAFEALVDEYVKDEKIKNGVSWEYGNVGEIVAGDADLRIEDANDFAESLVGIVNKPANIAPLEEGLLYEDQMFIAEEAAKNGMLNELFESEIATDFTQKPSLIVESN